MTRRSTRIEVATPCCLPAVAASASAQCEIAFQTKPKCGKRLKARTQAFAQAAIGPRPFLVCLPDTVDPRGSKGGK